MTRINKDDVISIKKILKTRAKTNILLNNDIEEEVTYIALDDLDKLLDLMLKVSERKNRREVIGRTSLPLDSFRREVDEIRGYRSYWDSEALSTRIT